MNGDSDSISKCSKDFSLLIEELSQPDVWTGAAAAANYKNFVQTHQSLITFINSFGNAFQEAMNSISRSIGELEASNLGTNTNVASLGLAYTSMNDLAPATIATEAVRYNADEIDRIAKELNRILGILEEVRSKLNAKINELNNNSGMWDGTSADQSKQSLSTTLDSNMDVVISNLNTCISNISMAAANAKGI